LANKTNTLKNTEMSAGKKRNIQEEVALKKASKLFHTFIMPIILLTIRLEIDIIF
jgi:hypothetical protein